MKLFSVIFGIIMCVNLQVVWGQSNNYSSKEKNTYWEGEDLLLKGNYLAAIQEFKTLEGVDETYSMLFYKIGKCLFELKEYDEALTYLNKGDKTDKEAYFLLAKLHLRNEELDSASFYVKLYEKKVRFSKEKRPRVEVDQLKNNVINADVFRSSPEDVNIINLGETVNSKFDEYIPLISTNEEVLLFTSRRDQSILDPLGVPFEDIYFSTNTGEHFKWSEAKLVEGKVNSPGHDACVGLSPDGNTLYVFRTHENLVTGDLYESKQTEEGWSEPVKMESSINNSNSTEPSASITLNGLTFYFSSDREGGYGGLDLYCVKRLPDGKWSLPLNLGPTINTPFDEDAPFIHPNEISLYFSSKGHNNMGGYDIFKAELNGEEWSKPKNLGVPINTTKDDIHFTISGNGKHGYYSSEKSDGLGGQDIYAIDFLEKELHQSVVSSTVLLDGKPIEAEVTLFDNQSADMVGVFISNANNGKFIFLVNPNVEYQLLIEGEGFERYTQTISFNVEELSQKQTLSINLTSMVK